MNTKIKILIAMVVIFMLTAACSSTECAAYYNADHRQTESRR